MKPFIPLTALTLLLLGIGLAQHKHLSCLESEIAALRKESGTPQDRTPNTDIGQRPIFTKDSTEELSPLAGEETIPELKQIVARMWEAMNEQVAGRTASFTLPSDTEMKTKLLAGLGHSAALHLIELTNNGAPLRFDPPAQPADLFVLLYMEINPAQGIRLLEFFPDLPMRDHRLIRAFSGWSNANAPAALAWFHQERLKENPVTKLPEVREKALTTVARLDPAMAVTGAIEYLATQPPANQTTIGAAFVTELRTTKQNVPFLKALGKAAEDGQDPILLGKIRSNYVSELSRKFRDAPFSEASAVIDTLYRPEEKREFASSLARIPDLQEPARWATWLMTIDAPTKRDHPFVALTIIYSKSHPALAGAWLEKTPEGELKNLAAIEYADQMSQTDPQTASQWAQRLPTGPARTRLVRQILAKWQKIDPTAAATFAKEQGL